MHERAATPPRSWGALALRMILGARAPLLLDFARLVLRHSRFGVRALHFLDHRHVFVHHVIRRLEALHFSRMFGGDVVLLIGISSKVEKLQRLRFIAGLRAGMLAGFRLSARRRPQDS